MDHAIEERAASTVGSRSLIEVERASSARLPRGWHGVEHPQGIAVRWTDGAALAVFDNPRAPAVLRVRYLVEKPLWLTTVHALVNGRLAGSFRTRLGLNVAEIAVPEQPGERLEVELVSRPFVPKRYLPTPDARRLGVMVHSVEIHPREGRVAVGPLRRFPWWRRRLLRVPRRINWSSRRVIGTLGVIAFVAGLAWALVDLVLWPVPRRRYGRSLDRSHRPPASRDFAAKQMAVYDVVDPHRAFPHDDLARFRRTVEDEMGLARRGVFAHLGQSGLKDLYAKRLLDAMGLRRGDRVLDVGCLSGSMLNSLHVLYGSRGVGVDLSFQPVRAGTLVNPVDNRLVVADATRLPLRDATFDGLISFDVLEHIADQHGALAEMARVLRPGRGLVLYTINRDQRWTYHWLLRQLTQERFGQDLEAGHDPEYFLDMADTADRLRALGFSSVAARPFHAMASLIVDEAFPMLVSAWVRGGLTFLTKALLMVLRFSERPLLQRGWSNGFFVVGRR